MGLGVQQLTNANALDVDRVVRAELQRLSATFPPGLKYEVAFDTTTAVADSISEGPEGWGFRFDEETPEALLEAVDRALALFQKPKAWAAAMDRAMARDHSWDRAAAQYEALYKG